MEWKGLCKAFTPTAPDEAFPYSWVRTRGHFSTLLSFLVMPDIKHRFGTLISESWLSFPKSRLTERTYSGKKKKQNKRERESLREQLWAFNLLILFRYEYYSRIEVRTWQYMIARFQAYMFMRITFSVRKCCKNYPRLQKASKMMEQEKP